MDERNRIRPKGRTVVTLSVPALAALGLVQALRVSCKPLPEAACRVVDLGSLNGLAVQPTAMERLPDLVAEGADPAAPRVLLWFRRLEAGHAWRAVEARRLDGERWRAVVSLPMEDEAERRFEVAVATCAPDEPASSRLSPRSWPVLARAPRVGLRATTVSAPVLTVAGSVRGAPAHARICLFGRNDGGPWRGAGTAPIEEERFAAELPARAAYDTPSRLAVVALAADGACPRAPFEPERPVPYAVSNQVLLQVPARTSAIEKVRPERRTGDMTPVDLEGSARHLLRGEHLWVQAFRDGGRDPVVAEAELTDDLTRWSAKLNLPSGRWRLYSVCFSAQPLTVGAPAIPAFDLVLR